MRSATASFTSGSTPAVGPELAVVIVNFQSWADVAALVVAMARSPLVEAGVCEILVVDNDSRQAIPDVLRTGLPGVRLLLEPTNGGFSAGVNVGWGASASPWLLVLNPDIVAGPDFLALVIERIRSYAGRASAAPGVVGFGLRNQDGTRQPSVGVFPSLYRTVREQVIPRTRRKYQPDSRLRPGPVDWVTGACFLVSTRLLADVGGMDEEFFLYHEEVALCRVARRRGWVVEYDPSVTVVHLHPLQDRAISPKMRVITRHSKLLYFRKHLPAWQFQALAALIRAEAKSRAIWCRLRGKSKEERAWRLIDWLARRPQTQRHWPGRFVRELAERADDPADPERAPGRADRTRGDGPGPPARAKQRSGRSRGARPTSP